MPALTPIMTRPAATRANFSAPYGLGAWHQSRPDLLGAALGAAHDTAPHLDRLADFLLPHAPRRPLASQTIRAITQDRYSFALNLDEAVTCPWAALDSQDARNVIAIDVDHDEGHEHAAELVAVHGLPRPTLVIDPWSGRCHAIWRLATPVITSPGARPGPRYLADFTARLLAAAMGGTAMPPRALLKSPWGRVENLIGQPLRRGARPAVPAFWEAWQAAATGLMWHAEPGDLRPIELGQVVAALSEEFGEEAAETRTVVRFRRRRCEPSALGRNCSLFDQTRCWAYDHVELDGAVILAEAQRVNATFATPLPASEVAATARSIARFMRFRYRPRSGISSSRGRDRAAGAELATKGDRQALAARVTAAARAEATDAKIAAALIRLRAAGGRITQAAVASDAGVGIASVKRRWSTLAGQIAKVSNAVLSGSARPSDLHPTPEEAPAASDHIEAIKVEKPKAAQVKTARAREDADQRHFLLPIAGKQDQRSSRAGIGEPPGGPSAGHSLGEVRPPPARRAA